MEPPAVTILIPTYARTGWLQEALWCAVNQTFPVRIVVLNDCPQQTLTCRHPRVTIHNYPNRIKTLGAKRNELLRLAGTEWVAWLDDDDWLLPWYIEDIQTFISEGLAAIFTTRCLHAYGDAEDQGIEWYLGRATQPMIVNRKAAFECGGFPADRDFGEDRVIYERLTTSGRVSSLTTVSGYCYRWYNGTYHLSGGDDPLGGKNVVGEAEFRMQNGSEPTGKILIKPKLRHDYFKNLPEALREKGFHCHHSLLPHQPITKQQIITFADQSIRLLFPAELQPVIDLLFTDFSSQQCSASPPVLLVKKESKSDLYSLLSSGYKEKRHIMLTDLARQLHDFAATVLGSRVRSGLVLQAGAVTKDNITILLPGFPDSRDHLLLPWLLSQSCRFLTGQLVYVDEKKTYLTLPGPLKLCRQELSNVLDKIVNRMEIQERAGSSSFEDIIPRHLTNHSTPVKGDIFSSILIFSEYTKGERLSIAALTSAQAGLQLMTCVANGSHLQNHGFSTISNLCRKIPALRISYGDPAQLNGVLDRLISIIAHCSPTPAELYSLTAPFNRPKLHSKIYETTPLTRPAAHGDPLAKILKKYPSGSLTPSSPTSGPRKKLTIGMATCDDYDGVYFTVQALRLYHPEVMKSCEILVVDNHPEGSCSHILKKLDTVIPGYRYLPEFHRRGTGVRDIIFREAEGEYVLCMDSHVLIVPHALQKLVEYLDNRPGCGDLLQGPLVHNDLEKVSTHLRPVWREGIYGDWDTDVRGQLPDADPFEIPMQGLGVFCCRRDAWPGFNPRFRGFGGEEGYIHEKFVKKGNRTLCLPFLRWLHRFGYPNGIPYEISWYDRIYNYLVGFRELGMDSSPMKSHFIDYLGEEKTRQYLAAAEEEMSSPLFLFDGVYCLDAQKYGKPPPEFHQLFGAGAARRIQPVRHPSGTGTAAYHTLQLHRTIIESARKLGYQHILILDVEREVQSNFDIQLSAVIKRHGVTSWSVLLVESNSLEPGDASPMDSQRVTPTPSPAHHTAIAYNCSVFDYFLKKVPAEENLLENWFRANGPLEKFLMTLPLAVRAPILP